MSSPNIYGNNLYLTGDFSSHTFYNILTYGASPGATAAVNNVAIQAAISAAQASTNGICVIPPGVFNISASMNLYSNTTILLQGTLKQTAGANICIFYIWAPAQNIRISGPGTLDINGSTQSEVFASGIINQSSAAGSLTNAIFEGFTIANAYYWPTNLLGCTDVTIRDVTVKNANPYTGFAGVNGPSGLGFAGDHANNRGSTNCWIERCRIYNCFDYGVAFYGSCTACGVRDTVINNYGAVGPGSGPNNCYGILVLNDAGQPEPSNGIVISGNSVVCCTQPPITTLTNAGGVGSHKNITISDNHTWLNSMGAYFASVSTVKLSNNIFEEPPSLGAGATNVTQAPIPGISVVPVSNGATTGSLVANIAGIGFPSNLVVVPVFNGVPPGWSANSASIQTVSGGPNTFTLNVYSANAASAAGYCTVFWIATGN
jgi:hypothetical protein